MEEIPDKKQSRLLGVSIRGWIAIILTQAVCIISFKDASMRDNLINGWLLALGFYFGQKNK